MMTEYHVIRITYEGGKTRDQKVLDWQGDPPKFTMKSAKREFGQGVVKLEVIKVRAEETILQTCEDYNPNGH